MARFLALPGAGQVVASCAVVFVPVFFAGVIFATVVPRQHAGPTSTSARTSRGVILGGLSENLSLILGFNHLLRPGDRVLCRSRRSWGSDHAASRRGRGGWTGRLEFTTNPAPEEIGTIMPRPSRIAVYVLGAWLCGVCPRPAAAPRTTSHSTTRT